MDKLTLAHDWAMKHGNKDLPTQSAWKAWEYAEAMFEEAEKRNHIVESNDMDKEWQPDWSLAPEWAKWWCVDINMNGNWFEKKPSLDGSSYWCFDSFKKFEEAPSFGYTGYWRDSLRMRPQGK